MLIPPPTQVAIDQNGQFTEIWYRYLKQFSNPEPEIRPLFKSVSFNTAGIDTASQVAIGTLPTGAIHTETLVNIKEAFNAGTTNVLMVGTAADEDYYVAEMDTFPTIQSLYSLDRGVGTLITADTPIFVRYTQSGTAATTGAADIIMIYTIGA